MAFFESKSKAKSQVIPFDPAQLQNMLGRLETLGETPMEFFPGQTYAEMDPRQTEALGMREQFARGMGGMVDPSLQAWQSMLSAPDVANNPYVQGMLEQQQGLLNRNLQENLLPGIGAGAIGAGQFGGSRHGVAEGIAARGTQEALARQAAETQMGAYSEGLQQQRYGLGAAPGMAQFGMMPADILAGVGGVGRTEEQRRIAEDMARFNFEQQEPWQRLQNQAALFNPLSLPYAASESKSTYSPSAMQSIGQGVGMVSSLIGSFTGGGGGGGNPWAQQTQAPTPQTPSYGGMNQNPFPTMGAYGFGGMQPYQSSFL